MDVNVQVGSWYVVEGDAGDTVTNPSTGKVIATVEEGKQTSFLATTPYVVTSADTVGVHKVNFKGASVKLRLLGQLGRGVDALPQGYLAAEFLEFGGKDKYVEVTTPWTPVGARVEVKAYERFYRVDVTSDEIGNGSHANYFFWGVKNSSGPKWYVGCGTYGITSFAADTNWHNMRLVYAADGGCWVDALKVRDCSFNANSKILQNFRLGTTTPTVNELFYPAYTWVKKCTLWVNGEKWRDVHAAIDPSGKPCFYDFVEKEAFYNGTETQLTVGLNIKQARNLGKLPEGGGELTVSLPWEAQLDKKVDAALQTAKSNGWTIVVQYQEPDVTSAVYNKYAECTTRADLDAVDPNWRLDLTSDGAWIYPLPEMTRLASMWTMNTGFPKNVLKRAVLNSPKATTATELFYGEKAIEYAEVYAPLATNCNWFAWKADNLKEVHFTGDNATMGVDSFARCYALSKFYGTLPKLSDAPGMFSYCQLDKESTLRILNSIPAHKSGTHQLSVGIHVDHQNDEEVLAAIALADIAQTPVSDGGKGWTLSVQWRGTATAQTASTFGLRRQPIYAKVREAETPEGTTERVLDWGHYVTNWEENGYQEFASEEEAREYFNIGD